MSASLAEKSIIILHLEQGIPLSLVSTFRLTLGLCAIITKVRFLSDGWEKYDSLDPWTRIAKITLRDAESKVYV